MERKTSLYDIHTKYNGKLVPFAGYLLPVQYEQGVINEHMAVRTAAGLFDVSHMGEIICSGKDATANLQKLLTNDYSTMPVGRAKYSPMCNENGGCVDDLIVYKKSDDFYFIVVNASNKEKDFAWIQNHKFGDVVFEDISDQISQIALQGPKAVDVLKKVWADTDSMAKNFYAVFDVDIQGIKCMVARTGYTGENGYEIYLSNDDAPKMWELLMDAGKEYGVLPCGLGARDTLRLESAMPLFGHEIDDEITPVESALSPFVKMDKEDFIGKSALQNKPSTRCRVGLKVIGRGIIREHQDVYIDGKIIGHTTSGTHCPYVGCPIAMAILQNEYIQIGTSVQVDVRGRMVDAQVIALPFYKKGDLPNSI